MACFTATEFMEILTPAKMRSLHETFQKERQEELEREEALQEA